MDFTKLCLFRKERNIHKGGKTNTQIDRGIDRERDINRQMYSHREIDINGWMNRQSQTDTQTNRELEL